jgi:hypothetical protein
VTIPFVPILTASHARHGAGIEAPPQSRKERALVQSCCNAWAAETGRPLCQLSLLLAVSIPE